MGLGRAAGHTVGINGVRWWVSCHRGRCPVESLADSVTGGEADKFGS